MSKDQSQITKQKVYDRWKGKCAFCGIYGTIEQHHMIAKSKDPALIDDPDNLILLCSNHHTLTLKKRPNGTPVISFHEIEDVISSRYVDSDRVSTFFDIPQSYGVVLGSNTCLGYPYVLVVNKKPLIEIFPKIPVHYVDQVRFFVTMRFFDEENNFLGGMFDNQWASITGEDWDISLTPEIIVRNKNKDLFVKLEKKENFLYITGCFYFDGIRIEASNDKLVLPGNKTLANNVLQGCAFSVVGDKNSAGFSIGGAKL